jgi:hypothetical protein
MGNRLVLTLRVTGFRSLFVRAGALVLRVRVLAGFFGRLLLTRFALAGLVLRRRVLGFLRAARRTVRLAGLAALAERGFFVFIPGNDPFRGRPICSDAPETTIALLAVQ